MASGREVHLSDLPPELNTEQTPQTEATADSWQEVLRNWATHELRSGQKNLLDSVIPDFERIMIETALNHTHGRRRDASLLLGWGRNTLTRKIKELGMDTIAAED